ncbi:MAG: hypothetical protein ABJA82_13250, partial [Myxococcales bacterium]
MSDSSAPPAGNPNPPKPPNPPNPPGPPDPPDSAPPPTANPGTGSAAAAEIAGPVVAGSPTPPPGSRLWHLWSRAGQALEDFKLLQGPRRRIEELARLIRILRDFLRGFRALHFVGPCVTVFGSARFAAADPYY